MAYGSCRGIIFRGYEPHIVESEPENVNGFLNKVSVLVTGVTKLHGWNANEQNASTRVTVASGFKPGIVRMPVDLFFESIENARPRVRGEGRCAGC